MFSCLYSFCAFVSVSGKGADLPPLLYALIFIFLAAYLSKKYLDHAFLLVFRLFLPLAPSLRGAFGSGFADLPPLSYLNFLPDFAPLFFHFCFAVICSFFCLNQDHGLLAAHFFLEELAHDFDHSMNFLNTLGFSARHSMVLHQQDTSRLRFLLNTLMDFQKSCKNLWNNFQDWHNMSSELTGWSWEQSKNSLRKRHETQKNILSTSGHFTWHVKVKVLIY